MSETNDVTSHDPILRARRIHKTYRLGRVRVPVLKGVDVDVERGEWVTILGASGSGKSTLLHLLGGLDRPDKPERGGPREARPSIAYDGRDIVGFGAGQLDRYRTRDVGFVFQFYHLLPELRVLENVTIGAMIRHGRFGFRGTTRRDVETRAKELLGAFGLGDRLGHRPTELSGGERQRVAIARALINNPPLLLADEPTGNLDRKTGQGILDVIAGLRQELGLTLVMVTHDESIAASADRVIRLADGIVAKTGPDGS